MRLTATRLRYQRGWGADNGRRRSAVVQYDDRGRSVGTASSGGGGDGGCGFRRVPVDRVAHQRPSFSL